MGFTEEIYSSTQSCAAPAKSYDTNRGKSGQTFAALLSNIMRLSSKITIVAGITLITLIASVIGYHAQMPDCAAVQSDGQCGLAAFLTILYALATTGAACLLATAYFVIQHIAARRKQSLQPFTEQTKPE